MKKLILLLITASLVACGGSSGSSGQPAPQPAFSPEVTNLSSMKLVDASGAPLANASVTITPVTAGGQMAATAMAMTSAADLPNLATDQDGNLTLNDLAPGTYTLTITIGSVTVTSTIVIEANNAASNTTVAAPVIVNGDTVTSLQNDDGSPKAIFASISGVIYSTTGPVSGAQISISGGTETNGAVASDVTDAEGRYLLIINVSLDKLEAMESAKLRVVKDGFINFSQDFNPTTALAFIGQNVALQPATAGSNAVVYIDNFNQTLSGATCGGWTTTALSNDYDMEYQGVATAEATTLTNLWHTHTAGLNITNAALTANLVQLAPDDNSNGRIPEPFDGGACWYGQASSDNVGTGNFLGTFESTQGGSELYGGTSDRENGGVLVSPTIDLTNEAAPLALSFRTWWEIESVNPNENGFDLMIVEYSLDNGSTWNNLARLNPLSDPESGEINRAPLPFSNRGFNRAPAWLWQEPIDISALAGAPTAKLRFVFSTEDGLYNGFRGWLIDDVRITREQGTFPLYEGYNWDDCAEEECYEPCPEEEECGINAQTMAKSAPSRSPKRTAASKKVAR